MGSLKRKIARNKTKRAKKDINKQMAFFDQLGDKCEACEAPYDKNLREHVTTWNVVVREDEKIVRLYCPQCWQQAKKVIKEIKNDFRIYKKS